MADPVRFYNQRFQESIIAIKHKDNDEGNTPIKVRKFFTNEEGDICLRYTNLSSAKEHTNVFHEEDYILDCPQVGLINYNGKMISLRRVPDRQWKRGYTPNVIRAEIPCETVFNEMNFQSFNIHSASFVSEVYNPVYPSFKESLSKVLKGKLFSFAISRKFGIGITWDAKFPVVFYKEWKVGWAEDETIQLPKQSHHLYEELSQYASCRRV